MAELAVCHQQRLAFRRHREVSDHRREVDVGQGYFGAAEIFGVGSKLLQCGKHLRCCRQPLLYLGRIRWPPEARPKDAMGKYLPHQRPVDVAVDDRKELAAAGAMGRVAWLETGTGECLVDVTRDRAGLVDLK